MAFVFSAILALLAVGIQSSIAEPINIHTAAAVNAAAANAASVQAAAATEAAALSSRLSPWLPSSSWYTPALLDMPPFYMPCDCDLSCHIDPRIQAEIERLAVLYGHRICNLQQWERIIHDQMPNLNHQNTINMLSQMAAAMRREQIRRGLAYAPEYAEFCLDYSIYSSAAVTPAILVKRDPMYTAADALAAQNAAATNAALTNAAITNPNFMPLYYNMQFMFEQFLPYISPELQRDIQNAVYNNTPYEYFGQAFTTAQRLKSNARSMVADMIDLTPGSINDPVSTLIY